MDPLPLVVTRKQALGAGLSADGIRWRLQRGPWTRLRRGLYLTRPAHGPHELLLAECAAAATALPEAAVFSHSTAAALWQLPMVGVHARPLQAVLPRSHRAALEGVEIHHGGLHAVNVLEGLRVASLADTAVDCARTLPFAEAVAIGDAALRADSGRRDFLRETLGMRRGWPGYQAAQRVVAFVDPSAESPLESVGRVQWHLGGLPPPDCQSEIYDGAILVARVDFLWREAKVVAEVDGRGKYADPTELVREKQRQNALVALGFTVFRFTWHDVVHRPQRCVWLLSNAIRRHAA